MGAVIKNVVKRGPAHRVGIKAGLRLLSVNGNSIADILDYKFHTYDRELDFELEDECGKRFSYKIYKPEGMDPGIEFETYLMDRPRSCGNKCVFCFIDQLPKGLRETLYFKDDDARLSFLLGNYITLTNLNDRDMDRIIKMRVSPVNVSVHTANPELRRRMLGNKKAGEIRTMIDRLCDAGISLNCQIVVCAGMNDGRELHDTLLYLTSKYPLVNSISVVPVGLTRYREGLPPLRGIERADARSIIEITDAIGEESLETNGSRLVYCADELYLKSEILLPEPEYYEDFPQLNNGVGMMALFEEETLHALSKLKAPVKTVDLSIATGEAAEGFIKRLIDQIKLKCDNVNIRVCGIKNEFFGGGVDVAGLVAGGDLVRTLSGENLGKRLLIPASMLRHEGDLFLDGVSAQDAAAALGIPVIPVPVDGESFVNAVLKGG